MKKVLLLFLACFMLACAAPVAASSVPSLDMAGLTNLLMNNKGKAVLLVSFELDEIMSLSDIIDVIFDGQIVASIPGKEANENDLGLMMAGGKKA